MPDVSDLVKGFEAMGGECFTCGEVDAGDEELSTDLCPKSRRPCGHHCNHVWTHDNCHWCEGYFSEVDGELWIQP